MGIASDPTPTSINRSMHLNFEVNALNLFAAAVSELERAFTRDYGERRISNGRHSPSERWAATSGKRLPAAVAECCDAESPPPYARDAGTPRQNDVERSGNLLANGASFIYNSDREDAVARDRIGDLAERRTQYVVYQVSIAALIAVAMSGHLAGDPGGSEEKFKAPEIQKPTG